MPTYEYLCTACGNEFELFHGMTESSKDTCPECGGPLKRLIGAGAGILVRSGSRAESMATAPRCGRDSTCCGRPEPCGEKHCNE